MDRNILSPKKRLGILVLVSLGILLTMGTLHKIDNEIYPIHEWRKFDSLSFALNYSEGDNFAEPSTQFLNDGGNRNAASEFPIVYYLFGAFWGLFGVSVLSTKVFGLLFSLLAVFLSSNIIFDLTKSFKKQKLYAAFFLLCPVYTFYFHSLIPNIYSLNLLLISLYFFYTYTQNQRTRDYLIFSICITLCILIKITSLIAIFSILGAAVFYFLFIEKSLFTTYRKLLFRVLGTIAFAFVCTLLWYSYAIEYNNFHGSSLFSTTIRPVWEVEPDKRWEIWKGIFQYQINGLFHPLILLGLLLIAVVKSVLSKSYFPLIFIGVSAIGITAYSMLWFWAIQNHDYYLIELIYFPVCLFAFLLVSEKGASKKYIAIYSTLGLFTILSSVAISQTSYGMKNFFTKASPFLTDYEKGNKWWFHSHHKSHLGALQKVASEIRELIPEEANVFAISDSSPNGHLVLLQRKGYSGFLINKKDCEIGERLENLGIKEGDAVVCYSDDKNAEALANEKYELTFSNEFVLVWERE